MATITKPYPWNIGVDSNGGITHAVAIARAGIDETAPRIGLRLGDPALSIGTEPIHVRIWAKRAPGGMRELHAAIPRSLAHLLRSIVYLGPADYEFAFRWTDGAPFSEADLADTGQVFIERVIELSERAVKTVEFTEPN